MLPAELRRADGLEPGTTLEVERLGPGQYRLTRVGGSGTGLVDWLLSCPEKGFFVPIESESTDSL